MSTQPQATPTVVQPELHLGFEFDPAHFPFTLLAELTAIAKEIRELGLEKTGGTKSEDRDIQQRAKYAYFEEAEIAAHLTALLNKHGIGYAAGTSRITGRFENGRTSSGGTMWCHHVTSAVIFSHAASKEWLIVPGVGEAADAGDKGCTKAITSAIKYVWMKTFLISEGNDIELDQSEPSRPPQEKTNGKPAPKKTSVINKCSDCKGDITAIKNNGKDIPAEIIAAKSKEKFGVILCANCGLKRSQGAERKQPEAKATPSGDGFEIIDGKLARKPAKRIVKGKKGNTPLYDLEFAGGVKVSDWHASHYDLYGEASAGDHCKVRIEVKQNGKYVNRNVVALMEMGDLCVEDEDGNAFDQGEPPEEASQVTSDVPFFN